MTGIRQQIVYLFHYLKNRGLIILFLLFGIFVIASVIRVLPYLMNQYYFEVGFDTGIYERLISFYTESNSWGILPAYPDFPSSYWPYIDQVEPGFLVHVALLMRMMNAELGWMFRYFIPVLTVLTASLICFVAGKHLSRSNLGGLLAIAFLCISYIQIEAINESYYRQILATLLIVLSAVYLDRYIETESKKHLCSSIILATGSFVYHISAILLLSVALLFTIFILIKHKDIVKIKALALGMLVGIILSSPAWIPKFSALYEAFVTAINESVWRTSTLPTGEGLWTSGGSIPEILTGYPHILLGYIVIFFPLVVLFVISSYILWKQRRLHLTIPMLSIIMWIYIGMWFFFGNRLLVSLDILVCIIAPLTIVALVRTKRTGKRNKRIIIVLIAVILLPQMALVVDNQTTKSPYIVDNMEGVKWIEVNIPEESVIFAPDYLSANLLQMGYLMGIWDYRLTNLSSHPMPAAEEFMLESPSNLTYVSWFFSNNPYYEEMRIFVIWGERDLTRTLVATGELIPVEDYSISLFYELRYDGYSEILKIYEYTGPR